MVKTKENESAAGKIGIFSGGVMMRYLFVFVFTCVLAHFCAETHASIIGDTISGYATYPANPTGNRFDNDTAVVSNDDIEFQIASAFLPATADFANDTLTITFTNLAPGTNQHVSWEFTFSSLDYGGPITSLTVLQDTFDTSPIYSWTQDSIDILVPGGSSNEMNPSETHLLELQVIQKPVKVGTAWSYQGRLIDANDAADGEYDFQFELYDADVGGNKAANDVNVGDLDVIDGYFTAELDFGGVFDGNDCYLEISVRPGDSNDPNAFVTLSPRQKVTPTPYALYALSGNEGPQGPQGEQGPQGPKGDKGDPYFVYEGQFPIYVDYMYAPYPHIGLNSATNAGDLIFWDGDNWIFKKPTVQEFDRDNMQPFLGVNFVIALQGVYPSRSAAEPFIAEIMMFGGNFAPSGWAFCNGQLLAISSNPTLYSLLGTAYGGDGQTTFALPDLRGRVPLHPGRGPGLSNRSLGERGGSETVLDTRLEN